MTDLIAELAEVVRLSADDDHDSMIGAGYAVRFMRSRAAEIEAMARDAQLWRKFSERVDPDKIPGGFTVYLNCDGYDELLYDATSLSAAMRDSAREGGDES